MTLAALLPVLLALAVLLAWFRLGRWQARAPTDARSRGWRLALLVALQPITAALLYLTLVPPPIAGSAGTLVVATADTPRIAALATGEALVALPEAPALPGAERVPDLATALRRHPGTTGLRIIGQGLAPRDRDSVKGLPLAFDPAPLPRGLVALVVPPPVTPGAAFRVGGSVNGVGNGRAELVDPAGAIIATASLPPSGDFALAGMAGVAGPADFSLRIRDASGALIETAAVPVIAAVQPNPRVLVIAGSAGPDLKYLRRWASDAGIDLKTSIAAGSDLDLGDAPARIDASSLGKLDLLVLDERSWASLGASQRAAVLAAVRGGLGVVLRVTGPVPEPVRCDWAGLGLPLASTETPLRLPVTAGTETPELTRLMLAMPSTNAVLLLGDSANAPVALWRGVGSGRIGLWPIVDLYALVLAGDSARHASIWASAFSTIARPQGSAAPRVTGNTHLGEQISLCNLPAPARVLRPDGQSVSLIVDRGCAAFFPDQTGWHMVRSGTADTPFLVTMPNPGIAAAQAREATWQRQNTKAATASTAGGARGPSWPWFIAWLLATTLLWWLERARFGRHQPALVGADSGS